MRERIIEHLDMMLHVKDIADQKQTLNERSLLYGRAFASFIGKCSKTFHEHLETLENPFRWLDYMIEQFDGERFSTGIDIAGWKSAVLMKGFALELSTGGRDMPGGRRYIFRAERLEDFIPQVEQYFRKKRCAICNERYFLNFQGLCPVCQHETNLESQYD